MFLIKVVIVIDCCFTGVACTISTASTDIMCDLVVNKSLKDAKYIIEQFENNKLSDEELKAIEKGKKFTKNH